MSKHSLANTEDFDLEQDGRVLARISAKALKNNFAAIQALAPGQAILPMIKANGYGHGAVWVARELLGLGSPALYGFGVASLEEGRELREALGPRARKIRIIVFTGAAPWTESKGHFCERHHLSVVIQADADWSAFLKGGWAERLSYEIMFNTGMNRLGLSPGLAPSLAKALRNHKPEAHPHGVFTHLASAEQPHSRLSQTQMSRFRQVQAELASALPATHFHAANSAAIWNQKQLGYQTDVVRPGLALYGIPPWKGAPLRGLAPVMSLEAKVVQIEQLRVGEALGYGGTFQASKEAVRYAVLGAGYADGLSRALSNQGWAVLRGERCQLIGRVSMDVSAIRAPSSARVGDWAQLFGDQLDPWEIAEAAGTIPYEILTSVSSRVQRMTEGTP